MPPRVLHIIDNFDRCSVEAWLLQMMAHARRRGVDLNWSFYCAIGKPGARNEEARLLGADIIHSPAPMRDKRSFVRALRQELLRGRYDVLHSHHDLITGVYLAAAFGLPIGRRVVHIHNADEALPTPSLLKKAILRPVLRRICLAEADRIAANSSHCLDTFLAGRARRPSRDVVHYLGIDPSRFELANGDRLELRRQLGFPADARILLFAGRMTPEKNPVYAVDVLGELRKNDPKAVGVFVGAGSMEEPVRARVAQLGLEAAVRCMGWRHDVPEIMAASDWFILPHPEHPMEGFGIAVVEAQLAGLRMLLSRGVSDEPLLPSAVFRRLPLAVEPAGWAKAAMQLWAAAAPSRTEALAALKGSQMNMDTALRGLMELHS